MRAPSMVLLATFLPALVLTALVLTACGGASEEGPPTEGATQPESLDPLAELQRFPPLGEARQGFETQLRFPPAYEQLAPDVPPPGVFELVRYPAPLGPSPAYVSVAVAAENAERKPAIVWVIGGFDFGISAYAWEPQPRENDQTAAAFREAGLVLMLPALRGFSGAPGEPECFYGEVEDVLAAGRYLASRPEVDPERIYLGGHSTGGTVALLAAESQRDPGPFKAFFAFGPIDDPRAYGAGCPPDDLPDESYEAILRAPLYWAAHLAAPTWVVEGELGNAPSAELLRRAAGPAPLRTTIVPGAGHFDLLRPASELLARQLLAGTAEDPLGAVDLSERALVAAMR